MYYNEGDRRGENPPDLSPFFVGRTHMQDYVHFGKFSFLKGTIESVEETEDVDGHPCVLVKYGFSSSILLYDEEAEAALRWAREERIDDAIESLYDKGNTKMPQPIEYSKREGSKPRASTAQRHPNKADQEKALEEKLSRASKVRIAVKDIIGTPKDLIVVDCRELWDHNHYRVNVWREIAGKASIAHSYYVELQVDGMVSNPPMERIES